MGDEQQFRAAFGELVIRGEAVLPAVLEAMERRDMEMRRRAFAVLQRLTEGQAVFDPHAPPALRQQQIASLREHLLLRRRLGLTCFPISESHQYPDNPFEENLAGLPPRRRRPPVRGRSQRVTPS